MNPSYFIHPSAIADEGARIGAGTKVWHFSHLMPRSVVGANCILGQNVFVDNDVVIGNGVKIQNNVSLYKGVLIEEDVFIGPSVVFTNVINPRSFIERKTEFRQTAVRQGATIGANATIVCGVEVGAYAFIGAGAVLTKDAKPFSLMAGNPAKHLYWIGKRGYQLIFNEKGEAKEQETEEVYLLKDGNVSLD
jgi:UDP-2-acetamido-3-amino-2,3-dideoxy-glucuronate N-acetyltransferase